MFSSEARYEAFERLAPAGVRRFVRPMIDSRESLDQFLRYVVIGAFVVGVDFTGFRMALIASVRRPLAVCFGLLLSNVTEFSLNRWCNFHAFDRALHEQLGKFALTAACTWLITLTGVEIFVRFAHFPPLLAKLAVIPFTLPISFFASRHIIFAQPACSLSEKSLQRPDDLRRNT